MGVPQQPGDRRSRSCACAVDEDTGVRACECDPGFELDGDDCVLGSPTTGMWLWLDADDTTSVTTAGGGQIASTKVETWTDTRGGTLPGYFSAAAGANQPTWKTNALNGRRVISLDGTDDFLLGGPRLEIRPGFLPPSR